MPSIVPRKKSEILIVGNGALVEAVVVALHAQKHSTLRAIDTRTLHFLGDNLASVDGEKVGFRRAFVLFPHQTHLPALRGIDKTKFVEKPIQTMSKDKKWGVYGSDGDAVEASIQLASANKVSLICAGALLADYDFTVQDAIRRHLNSMKVDIINASPIAGVTKGQTTSLLVKQGTTTKQLDFDYLFIERVGAPNNDIGLSNQHVYLPGAIGKLTNSVLAMNEAFTYSLADVEKIVHMLTRRTKQKEISSLHAAQMTVNDTHIFSFGIKEQDIIESHLAYQKSIARTKDDVSVSQGFIKVLANRHGRIISLSGILPASYQQVEILKHATFTRMKVAKLIELFDMQDEIASTLLEVNREIQA